MYQKISVELPEELAAEAVRHRLAQRTIRRRGPGEALILILGAGGSLVSLIQAPMAIEQFSRWLAGHLLRRRETTIFRVTKDAEKIVIELPHDSDPDTTAELIQKVLTVSRSD